MQQRADDTPEAVDRRLDLYEEQTAPLIEYFSSRGALAVVNGVGHPDHVFKRLTDAIEAVRKNPFANAVSIFTTSGKSAREFRYRVGVSMIGVNIGVAAPMAFFPFGGTKGSFFGDLKAHGTDAIEFYTDKKVVISRWT